MVHLKKEMAPYFFYLMRQMRVKFNETSDDDAEQRPSVRLEVARQPHQVLDVLGVRASVRGHRVRHALLGVLQHCLSAGKWSHLEHCFQSEVSVFKDSQLHLEKPFKIRFILRDHHVSNISATNLNETTCHLTPVIFAPKKDCLPSCLQQLRTHSTYMTAETISLGNKDAGMKDSPHQCC